MSNEENYSGIYGTSPLETCPFCGEMPMLEIRRCYKAYEYRISCWNFDCGVIPKTDWFLTEKEAALTWNLRSRKLDKK